MTPTDTTMQMHLSDDHWVQVYEKSNFDGLSASIEPIDNTIEGDSINSGCSKLFINLGYRGNNGKPFYVLGFNGGGTDASKMYDTFGKYYGQDKKNTGNHANAGGRLAQNSQCGDSNEEFFVHVIMRDCDTDAFWGYSWRPISDKCSNLKEYSEDEIYKLIGNFPSEYHNTLGKLTSIEVWDNFNCDDIEYSKFYTTYTERYWRGQLTGKIENIYLMRNNGEVEELEKFDFTFSEFFKKMPEKLYDLGVIKQIEYSKVNLKGTCCAKFNKKANYKNKEYMFETLVFDFKKLIDNNEAFEIFKQLYFNSKYIKYKNEVLPQGCMFCDDIYTHDYNPNETLIDVLKTFKVPTKDYNPHLDSSLFAVITSSASFFKNTPLNAEKLKGFATNKRNLCNCLGCGVVDNKIMGIIHILAISKYRSLHEIDEDKVDANGKEIIDVPYLDDCIVKIIEEGAASSFIKKGILSSYVPRSFFIEEGISPETIGFDKFNKLMDLVQNYSKKILTDAVGEFSTLTYGAVQNKLGGKNMKPFGKSLKTNLMSGNISEERSQNKKSATYTFQKVPCSKYA